MNFSIDQWEPLKKEIEIARVKENQVKAFRSAQTAFWRGKVFFLFRARLIFQNQAIYTFINPVWLLFFRKLMQALISNDVTWLDPNLDRILPNYVYSQNHGWSFKPSENGLTNVKLLVLFASTDGAPFNFKAPQGGGRLFKLWSLPHCPQQCTMQLFIQLRILDSQRCGPQQKPNVTTLGKCENRAIKYGMQAFISREAHFFSFSAHFMDCKAFGPTTIWKGQMLRN